MATLATNDLEETDRSGRTWAQDEDTRLINAVAGLELAQGKTRKNNEFWEEVQRFSGLQRKPSALTVRYNFLKRAKAVATAKLAPRASAIAARPGKSAARVPIKVAGRKSAKVKSATSKSAAGHKPTKSAARTSKPATRTAKSAAASKRPPFTAMKKVENFDDDELRHWLVDKCRLSETVAARFKKNSVTGAMMNTITDVQATQLLKLSTLNVTRIRMEMQTWDAALMKKYPGYFRR